MKMPIIVLIIVLASDLGANTVNLEQGIEDKDIPEEKVGEDSSGGTFLTLCQNIEKFQTNNKLKSSRHLIQSIVFDPLHRLLSQGGFKLLKVSKWKKFQRKEIAKESRNQI